MLFNFIDFDPIVLIHKGMGFLSGDFLTLKEVNNRIIKLFLKSCSNNVYEN